MTAILVQLALSNLVASVVLAGIAYAVHRRGRFPVLAHLLWVLVLLKLVTPPLVSLPLDQLPAPSGLLDGAGLAAGVEGTARAASIADHIVTALLLAWAVGSALVLSVSAWRIYRFDRLLRRSTVAAPGWVQFIADDTARRIGLAAAPGVTITGARLSPMTWWAGGRIRVVLPQGLIEDIEADQLAWVLGHELAHVKRRDHLVRWLEWFACVSFWWNPVAWWARANLRLDEEASCDAVVLDHLGARPRPYARALLAVAEHLSFPSIQPPAVATGIDGGVSLERRFRMILASPQIKHAPRWLAIGLVGSMVVTLPLGVGVASDDGPGPIGPMGATVDGSSDREQAFLDDTRRDAARAVYQAQLRTGERTTARLSAKVGTVAKTSRGKAGKGKRARDREAGKAAVRARRAKTKRQAENDRVVAPDQQGIGEPVHRVIHL